MDKYKTKQSAQYSYKGKKPKVGKPGAGAMFIQLKSLKSLLGLKKGGDTMLKPVPADKKKSLGKLPTDVRNKMGYAKKGKMMKTIHSTDHPDVKMTQKLYAKNKIYAGSKEEVAKNLDEIQNKIAKKRTKTEGSFSKGGEMIKKDKLKTLSNIAKSSIVGSGALAITAKEAREIMKQVPKKSMGGEMKQGYGAARTSGMGLQDEDLIPGKSMDYYKDLM